MKTVHVFGATGSIGKQTIEMIETYKEAFKLGAISARYNVDEVINICNNHNVSMVVMDQSCESKFKQAHPNIQFLGLPKGLTECIKRISDGVLVNALVGSVGLEPTLTAIELGIDVLLANKESLVVGGPLIQTALSQSKARLIPIDSEHAAVKACLKGSCLEDVERIIITASGGSLRDHSIETLNDVRVEDALNHPNWDMGAKITIDSATLMNKVFEIIEAHYLFDLPYKKIQAVLHKESVIHAIVEFVDGNRVAHLGPADMRIPILSALQDETRFQFKSLFDLTKIQSLNFAPIDFERYPLFDLGMTVVKMSHMHIVTMNAANEVAVEMFLNETIKFGDIQTLILAALNHFEHDMTVSLPAIIAHDKAVRKYLINRYT